MDRLIVVKSYLRFEKYTKCGSTSSWLGVRFHIVTMNETAESKEKHEAFVACRPT